MSEHERAGRGQGDRGAPGPHLARTADLYVRQSTQRQVLTNTESATRQYALRQKAIALGWAADAIVTIDTDQGQSGASAADREGFQRLVAEVGMGRAGIVLGLGCGWRRREWRFQAVDATAGCGVDP